MPDRPAASHRCLTCGEEYYVTTLPSGLISLSVETSHCYRCVPGWPHLVAAREEHDDV